MSKRCLRLSGSIKQFASPVDAFKKVRIRDVLFLNDVHFPSKKRFQRFLKAEVLLEDVHTLGAIVFDQKIEIALLRVKLPLRGGTEELQPANAILATQLGESFEIRVNRCLH